MKSVSPMDSARNGFEALVKMDRTDSGKLNIPSPHGSFQRTQSFIKQILSMKADLNQLFPTEDKEKTKYSPSPSASSASSDFQCSSSRSYGMYKKKNNRSVKLAPLTPDSVSFSTPSTDVTPASSKRLSVGFSAQESPSDHSRLWQDVHSPTNDQKTLPSVHVPPPRALNPTIARNLHFAEDDELINLHSDDSSVSAVQCDEDYYNIHYTRSQDPLPRKISKPRKSVTLDALDRSFMGEPAITLAPLRSSLPNTLQSSSSETIVDEYDARSLTLPYSSASTSFSQSVDGDDEMDQRIYAPLQVRTKSYNGAGLSLEMSDVAREEDAMVSTAVKVKQSPRVSKQIAPRNTVAAMPSKEIEVEPVDDYGDDDFVDLDNDVAAQGAAESEVELFLDAYCSGKETQATTALEALSLESSSKKSVKQRKGTGIPAKKLLSMSSYDDDGEIEEFDDSDSVTEKTYRSVSQGSSGRRDGYAHGYKYATEEDDDDNEEANNNCALYSRSMDATMDPYHDDVDIIYVL